MKRKDFLCTTLAAMPLFAFPCLGLNLRGTKQPFIVRAGKSRFNQPMKYRGVHPNDIIISKKDTDNALSLFSYTGFAKVGPSFHLHFDQDEIFTVIEGRYRFVVGEETSELEAGDTIFLPRNIPHSWIQLTDQGKLTYMVQPAGMLEEFFLVMSQRQTPPSEEESQKIHFAHGMKIIGPPLTL